MCVYMYVDICTHTAPSRSMLTWSSTMSYILTQVSSEANIFYFWGTCKYPAETQMHSTVKYMHSSFRNGWHILLMSHVHVPHRAGETLNVHAHKKITIIYMHIHTDTCGVNSWRRRQKNHSTDSGISDTFYIREWSISAIYAAGQERCVTIACMHVCACDVWTYACKNVCIYVCMYIHVPLCLYSFSALYAAAQEQRLPIVSLCLAHFVSLCLAHFRIAVSAHFRTHDMMISNMCVYCFYSLYRRQRAMCDKDVCMHLCACMCVCMHATMCIHAPLMPWVLFLAVWCWPRTMRYWPRTAHYNCISVSCTHSFGAQCKDNRYVLHIYIQTYTRKI
jgi:hypothetical protein